MRRGNLSPNGQPWSKKQRKASRYGNYIRGGFNRNATTHIDLKKVGMMSGFLAGILGMAMGRRKKT